MTLVTYLVCLPPPGITSWLPILWGWPSSPSFSWLPSTSSSMLLSRYWQPPIIPLFIFEESGAKNQKRTHRQKRDRQIASLLILLVIVFGSCNIVRVIFLMMEWWCDDGGYYGEYAFLLHSGLFIPGTLSVLKFIKENTAKLITFDIGF